MRQSLQGEAILRDKNPTFTHHYSLAQAALSR